MDPMMVVMGIRSTVRLARAGDQAYTQHVVGREVPLPTVESLNTSKQEKLRKYFVANEDKIGPEAKRYLDSLRETGPKLVGDIDFLAAEYARIMVEETAGLSLEGQEAAGLWLVSQWGRNAPISPVTRLLLTMTDVALEYAAHDPGLFGVKGRAEPLFKAFATHISALIPKDPAQIGAKSELAERLSGIFLRSALGTLSQFSEVLEDDKPYAALVKSVLPPLIDAMPEGLDLPEKRDFIESLLGPVANAAVATIAAQPAAFLGDKFNEGEAVGALTKSFLLTIAGQGLEKSLTRDGAAGIYKSLLSVVATQPALFFDAPQERFDKLSQAALQSLIKGLQEHSPAFSRDVIARVFALSLESTAQSGLATLSGGKPWEVVAGDVGAALLSGLKIHISDKENRALQRLDARDLLVDFIGIVLEQAAKTPQMLGVENEEVQRIVATIAQAMASDEHLLLGDDDWLEIVAVAAETAAADPGRLFGLNPQDPKQELAGTIIQALLKAATQSWGAKGRANRGVLFGATLRDAIVVTLKAAAGNAKAAFTNAVAVQELAAQIEALVSKEPGRFGSKEWSAIYRALVVDVLATGVTPTLDAAALQSILERNA
jgi:hypothetical protein